MKKFYFLSFLLCIAFSSFSAAQKKKSTTGTIIIHLDQSQYENIAVEEAYIVFDKYDCTYAGFIRQKYPVVNNQIVVADVPRGKYYVDVYTLGNYHQHFTSVMYAGKKTNKYTLKFDDVTFYSRVFVKQ